MDSQSLIVILKKAKLFDSPRCRNYYHILSFIIIAFHLFVGIFVHYLHICLEFWIILYPVYFMKQLFIVFFYFSFRIHGHVSVPI